MLNRHTRRSASHPVHRRSWLQIGLVLAVTIAVAVAIQWAWLSAPEAPLDRIAPAAEQPGDPEIQIVTCERTLPDAPETTSDIADIDPVGRVSSSEVNACPDAFDGHVVVFVGEVVGDILHRDGGAWVLVNDDAYALEVGPLSGHTKFRGANTGLSVWLPTDQASVVDEPGDANRRGDVIRVRGRILRTDPADGGGLTLRAVETSLVVDAQALSLPVNRVQLGLAIVLVVGAVALIAAERRATGRR